MKNKLKGKLPSKLQLEDRVIVYHNGNPLDSKVKCVKFYNDCIKYDLEMIVEITEDKI